MRSDLLLGAFGFLGVVATASAGGSTEEIINALDKRDYSTKPNIVFILVDDLDQKLNSMDYMPLTKKHIYDEGTNFPQHYCTVSLCCPARATLLTGMNAHNHNVTDVSAPAGGYQKFADQFNNAYLPIWFREAGYSTYYTGKLMNEYSITTFANPLPRGWTDYNFLADPGTYSYSNPILVNNGLPKEYKNTYNTDLIANKSFDHLDMAAKSGKPFFIALAPIAPHSEVNVTLSTQDIVTGPPRPAQRHVGLFPDAKVPRTANFNPDDPSGASWVRHLPQLNDSGVEYNDNWYRARLQALQAVDEMVDSFMKKLEAKNLLDNTYVVFTSDNGFHISQHRLTPGKTCGYEEDINVPLAIRGPGIRKGHTSYSVSAHVDILPTLFKIAGIPQRDSFDGQPIALTEEDEANTDQIKIEHANIEMWKTTYSALKKRQSSIPAANTYKSVRLIGKGYSLYYSVWCTNEHELYDMSNDMDQMNNLFSEGFTDSNSSSSDTTLLGVSVESVASRLDAMLFVLKSCQGDNCRDPWQALLPGSDIHTLTDALDSKYDNFFQTEVPRVSFTSCESEYIVSAEGPQYANWTMNGRKVEDPNERSLSGEDPFWAVMT